MRSITRLCQALAATVVSVTLAPAIVCAADVGLISKPSKHSVQETVERFENAIKAKGGAGWMVFTEMDHAAAASKAEAKTPLSSRTSQSLAVRFQI